MKVHISRRFVTPLLLLLCLIPPPSTSQFGLSRFFLRGFRPFFGRNRRPHRRPTTALLLQGPITGPPISYLQPQNYLTTAPSYRPIIDTRPITFSPTYPTTPNSYHIPHLGFGEPKPQTVIAPQRQHTSIPNQKSLTQFQHRPVTFVNDNSIVGMRPPPSFIQPHTTPRHQNNFQQSHFQQPFHQSSSFQQPSHPPSTFLQPASVSSSFKQPAIPHSTFQPPPIQFNQFKPIINSDHSGSNHQISSFQQDSHQNNDFRPVQHQINTFQQAPQQTNNVHQVPHQTKDQTNSFQPNSHQANSFHQAPHQTNQQAQHQSNPFQQAPHQANSFHPAPHQTRPQAQHQSNSFQQTQHQVNQQIPHQTNDFRPISNSIHNNPLPSSFQSNVHHVEPTFEQIQAPHHQPDVFQVDFTDAPSNQHSSDFNENQISSALQSNSLNPLAINKVPPVNAGVLPLAHEQPLQLEVFPPFNTG